MLSKHMPLTLGLLATVLFPATTVAQEDIKSVFTYLQKEPMTLYDAGMKSLRRMALDTAARLTTSPDLEAASGVNYKPTVGQIEIIFSIKTKDASALDVLRQQCIAIRKDAILKMFRIGLTQYSSPLSVNERIRNRIGGQFAHEPMGSMQETQRLGDRIGPITYFTVKLSTTSEPTVSVTCSALVSDAMSTPNAKPPSKP